MPWHCRCIAVFWLWLMPTLVCFVALLLLLTSHGINLCISAAVFPTFFRLLKELIQHHADSFTLLFGGRKYQTTNRPQLQRQGFLCRVVGVQKTPVRGILCPAQVPGGAQVVADVKGVIVHRVRRLRTDQTVAEPPTSSRSNRACVRRQSEPWQRWLARPQWQSRRALDRSNLDLW